jgi:uncharacterized membrane protein YczE
MPTNPKIKPENKKRAEAPVTNKPWISMRSGVIVIAIVSIGMAILTALQAVPTKGLVEGIFWGVFFGVGIWFIFFGMILVNRFLRKK